MTFPVARPRGQPLLQEMLGDQIEVPIMIEIHEEDLT